MHATDYQNFINGKSRLHRPTGFDPDVSHDWLYDFQASLVVWALRLGRAAIFADCGLGKTAMQLAWADHVVRRENRPVLILTPLAVGQQTVAEAGKFGVDATRCLDGRHGNGIIVTNYERLHYFDPANFSGIVCDESSILKNYSGATRSAIVSFMQSVKYRLLCSATPSPNDYTELGNSVEALSLMRRVEMLASYFVHDGGATSSWRLKGHANNPFWRFVSSWARALRKPSDIGPEFSDERFVLPDLLIQQHVLDSDPMPGRLFPVQAVTLDEQRQELRATIKQRCRVVADIANADDSPFIAWCSLNAESESLRHQLDDASEITGAMSDEEKEYRITAFQDGQIKRIVTKPSMSAFGLNWQHCHRMSFFPSHSHEQFYQAVRRCLRFGQTSPVDVSLVTTTANLSVMANLQQKEHAANTMFDLIISNMQQFYSHLPSTYTPATQMKVPSWL